MDARIGGRHGKQTAYEIFAWDEVTLSIQDDCAIKEKKIDEDLQAILFDAMRLKDEAGEDEEAFSEELDVELDEELDVELDEELDLGPIDKLDKTLDLEDTATELHDPQPEPLSLEDTIRNKLESVIGPRNACKIFTRTTPGMTLLFKL